MRSKIVTVKESREDRWSDACPSHLIYIKASKVAILREKIELCNSCGMETRRCLSQSKVSMSCFFLCNSFSWWCALCTYSSEFCGLHGQRVTGEISWGSSFGLVLLSSWECSRKQFSMQSSRTSATPGSQVGSNYRLLFNWWGRGLMACAKLGWQMHIEDCFADRVM